MRAWELFCCIFCMDFQRHAQITQGKLFFDIIHLAPVCFLTVSILTGRWIDFMNWLTDWMLSFELLINEGMESGRRQRALWACTSRISSRLFHQTVGALSHVLAVWTSSCNLYLSALPRRGCLNQHLSSLSVSTAMSWLSEPASVIFICQRCSTCVHVYNYARAHTRTVLTL